MLNKDFAMSTATKTRNREYIPTPEEISRMTAKIRKGWTPQIRMARRRQARVYQNMLLSNSDRFAA